MYVCAYMYTQLVPLCKNMHLFSFFSTCFVHKKGVPKWNVVFLHGNRLETMESVDLCFVLIHDLKPPVLESFLSTPKQPIGELRFS